MEVRGYPGTMRGLFYTLCGLLIVSKFGSAAERANGKKEQECHNYAGGHVYPGEAFRVPVSDHSLHLSKAKSKRFLMFIIHSS